MFELDQNQRAPCDFVDDLMDGARELEQCWYQMEKLVVWLLTAGVEVSTKPAGLVPPAQSGRYVGWSLTTNHNDSGMIYVMASDDKLLDGQQRINDVLRAHEEGWLYAQLLLSCIGFLNFLAQVQQAGRRRLHCIYRCVNAAGIHAAYMRKRGANLKLSLDEDAIRELRWWLAMIQRSLLNPLGCARQILPSELACPATLWTRPRPNYEEIEELLRTEARVHIAVFESDASKYDGWSYCDGSGHVTSGEWPQDMMDVEINAKEFDTIVRVVREQGQQCSARGQNRIYIRNDNENAVRACNTRFSKNSKAMNVSCDELDELEERFNVLVVARHLEGKRNVIADRGSRDASFAEAHNRDPLRDVSLADAIFSALCERFQSKFSIPLSVDCFAADSGDNAKFSNFFSPSRYAFAQDTTAVTSKQIGWYAFPPPSLAKAWLQHCKRLNLQYCITVLSMNHSMWRFKDSEWIAQNFSRIMVLQKDARCFCMPGSDHHGKAVCKRIKTHYPVWLVHLRP